MHYNVGKDDIVDHLEIGTLGKGERANFDNDDKDDIVDKGDNDEKGDIVDNLEVGTLGKGERAKS